MPTSIIIDLIIAAVLALSIFLGWTKGMVRGLLTLAGTILAFLVAAQIGDAASGLIVDQAIRPATHAAIEQHFIELSPEDLVTSPFVGIEQAIDAIEYDLVREKARELLSSLDLPTEVLTGSRLLTVSIDLVDTVLNGPVREAISAILCILCFAVISLALRPVIWMIEQAFQLPLLRQINQLGGLVSGAVRGIVLVLIAVWALRLTGMYATEEVIAQSFLLKLAVQCLDAFGLGSPAAF